MNAATAKGSSSALTHFQSEARCWLAANFPTELAGRAQIEMEDGAPISDAHRAWRNAIGAKGWGTPLWPRDYGGGGLTREEASVFSSEMQAIGAWNPIGGIGVMMLGPTLLEHGTEEQKARHVPPISRGEVRWCQGYSEPGAGSDLASLQTQAEDLGDCFLVNGQKIWTSGAQYSDWCFALVRTDRSSKHGGISFLLLDMRSPGVEVRPIRLISGASLFCEVFFTDVRVPKENLVGSLNGGWTIGKRLLQFERTSIGGGAARTADRARTLGEIAMERRAGPLGDGPLADMDLRSRIAAYDMENRAFSLTLQQVAQGGGPSTTSSILKNVFSRLAQDRNELMLEIMGMDALTTPEAGVSNELPQALSDWLFSKAATIYGGSQEVQNNIIARRILGLPDGSSKAGD